MVESNKPIIIGLGGLSCSGKTTLARLAAAELADLKPTVIGLDCYYSDLSAMTLQEREAVDFDDPESLDWPLLLSQVDDLAAGRSIERPVYDYEHHTRRTGTVTVRPGGAVILEGVFALDRRLIGRLDLAVFVNVDPDEAYNRRLARDMAERGRRPDYVAWQWEHTVMPGYRRHIAPATDRADLILESEASLERNQAVLIAAVRETAARRSAGKNWFR